MIGRTIGHYHVLACLGEGGMGVVYKAEDTRLGRTVALKLLPPELTRDPEARRRFEREARAASLLDHQNICTVYDFGATEVGGQMYIAMACYDGESLADRVARPPPMSLDDALRVLEQICRGLGKAHASGVIHRDIKPGNVILTSDGVVKIVDFGLAKLSAGSQLTKSRTSLGTAAYMAPEQLRGGEVGPQADIWAAGIVLFELLTGQRPFRGEYAEALSYAILNEQPATITEIRNELPVEIDRIIKKMLRKDPLQRYATTEEVITELEVLRTPSSSSGKSGPRAARLREPFRAGAKLGPYEIVEPLGSGGMGDVYRARDTRLDRQVALKVLAPEFTEDAERKQRFQREAKTISSLSHPNICTLFDVGEQEGTDYLVMEYLEGETLAERIARGALPLGELLKTGIQIGEALGRAHQQGIVHRDLKPGNVMLTKSGAVKLVDFGLAKDVGAVTTTPRKRSGTPPPDKPLTAEGAIIGTLAYMAPEQVEGREADARSDIFAFGAILYEMATGKRAFEGATKANLIAAILEREPPLIAETLVDTGSTSGSRRGLVTIEHLVRRCLEKDPERRAQSSLDIANELRWIGERGPGMEAAETTQPSTKQLRSWRVATAVVTLLLFVALGVTAWLGRFALGLAKPTAMPVPNLVQLTWEQGDQAGTAISPDGANFLYCALAQSGGWDIFSRRVGGESAINLTKDCAELDFWPSYSPDGQSIAFYSARDGGGIFIMGATGESVRRLTNFGSYTAGWSPDGKTLAFAGVNRADAGSTHGIWVVDVSSGSLEKIYDGDGDYPVWAPSGKRIAFSGTRGKAVDKYSIWTIPASGGEPVELVSRCNDRRTPFAWSKGWIWYSAPAGGTSAIWRIRVNETTGAPLGSPELAFRQTTHTSYPSVSADGERVAFFSYSDGITGLVRYELDAARGHVSAESRTIFAGTRAHHVQRVSPDGAWLASWTEEGDHTALVLVRTSTGETRHLTNEVAPYGTVDWAPDGSKIYFLAARAGKWEVWSIRPDGSGRELVATSSSGENIVDILPSPDGRTLFVMVGVIAHARACKVDLSVPLEQRQLTALPPISETEGFVFLAASPDGRWMVGSLSNDEPLKAKPGIVIFDVVQQTYRKVADVKGTLGAAWLPDSRRVVLWNYAGGFHAREIRLLDRETGVITVVGTVKGDELAISPDGQSLFANTAISEGDSDIWMLDYRTKP